MTNPESQWRRRIMLTGGALVAIAWVVGAPKLPSLKTSRLSFRDLPGLARFRFIERSGPVSEVNIALVGLDQETAHIDGPRGATVRANPCKALFGRWPDGLLPVAVFSDFNCPNCRALEDTLSDYIEAHPGTLHIVRHELPLLGAASVTASKAVLAADSQGGYHQLRAKLMRTRFVTDLDLVASIAEDAGLDPRRLLTDMQTEDIENTLANSKAIAGVFGFYGTPATVIGRTAFMGAISAGDISQIIATEQATPPMKCH